MLASHVASNRLFQFVELACLGTSLRKHRTMNLFGRVPAGLPYDDLFAILLPFED
jgi:hypothetical protein